MHNSIKFSVILPVFNQENNIKKAITSILRQDYQNIEIVCVNDGSTDSSLQIIKELAEKEPKIQFYDSIENKGTHMARKYGVEIASGDYCIFLDPDDELATDTFNILNEYLHKEAVDILEFSMVFIRNGKKQKAPIYQAKKDDLMNLFFTHSVFFFSVCCRAYQTVFCKQIFSNMESFYAIFAEDWYELFNLIFFCNSYLKIADELYLYNDNAGIMQSKVDMIKFNLIVESYRNVLSGIKAVLISNNSPFIKYINSVDERLLHGIIVSKILNQDKVHREQLFALLKDASSPKMHSCVTKYEKNFIVYRFLYRWKNIIKKTPLYRLYKFIKRLRAR